MANNHIPMLSLVVDFDLGMINRIIGEMDQHIDHNLLKQKKNHRGLFLSRTTPKIKNVVVRLLRAIQSPVESKVLGEGIVHELIFRIMCSENASSLYALAMKNTNLARIDKALKLIHENYQDSINVEKLADIVNMSPSSFHRAFKKVTSSSPIQYVKKIHRAFKKVTSSSPIQYVKKIRLDKAKSLLIEQGLRVNEAATQVGYESTTQFSREFKRHFGNSPISYRLS
jgi:AraC-like DNA-binding protein